MRLKKIPKLLLPLLVVALTLFINKVSADIPIIESGDRQNPDCDAEQKFVDGTWCPCSDDPSLASVCGLVRSADINTADVNGREKVAYTTRNPISNITVGIYENVPGIPTGQPFGNLGNKLGECITSETEGKYFCQMRRLSPGNKAHVIFACGGRVVDYKIIESPRSIVGLNADVSCSGDISYQPLPTTLSYAERDKFLGCTSEPDKVNSNIGFEKPEYVYHSAQIGEKGGDIRFAPRDPIIFGFLGHVGAYFGHVGAYWSNDCLIKFDEARAEESVGGSPWLDRTWWSDSYRSVEEKCGFVNEWEKTTTPFRFDIPDEDAMLVHRSWETRTSVQRELQDPRAFQQYNHVTFGDCLSNANLRYYGEDNKAEPIACVALASCLDIGDPRRNIHTTHSFGSRLASPIAWGVLSELRNKNDIVCRDTEGDWGAKGADITLAEVQPPYGGEDCTPGKSGCPYKLPKDYFLPQFSLAAEGVKKPITSETVGDKYGPQGVRGEPWEPISSEAQQPHRSGHYVNYECSGPNKNNCGVTSVSISTDEYFEGRGTLSDGYRSFVDVQTDTYADTFDSVVYDAGGDIKSLCTISSVQENMFIPSVSAEKDVYVNNTFTGNEDSHREDNTAGTATYGAEEVAVKRDLDLGLPNGGERTLSNVRDAFDSFLRFASGGAKLNFSKGWWANTIDSFNALLSAFFERSGERVKSFAERVNQGEWSPDTDSPIKTHNCISEKSFLTTFPPYYPNQDNGYPGNAGACYPWFNVPKNEHCNVWPGPGEDPVGELRTCKINECARFRTVRKCRRKVCGSYECYPKPFPDVECDQGSCPSDAYCEGDCSYYVCTNETITVQKIGCSTADKTECLRTQEDTWRPSNAWIKNNYPPPPLTSPNFNNTRSEPTEPFCDLSRAGPMQVPGDIGGENGFTHAAQAVQQPFGVGEGTQLNSDPISRSGNDSVNRWTSPVVRDTYYQKAAFNDYATTNDYGGVAGSGAGATHRYTAGALTKGQGFGGTSALLDPITHPETPGSLIEDFPVCDEATGSTQCWECNPLEDEDSWCYRVPPPGEVDVDSLDGGACKPKITGSCPLVGEGVGELALNIVGSAGENAGGVPGSLLLAAVVGEVDWLANYRYDKDTGEWIEQEIKMSWDDTSIRSYSSPWHARVPSCDDMVPTAQGPFGLLSSTFEGSVLNENGYHPYRLNSEGKIYYEMQGADGSTIQKPIVSKCNFLDAAYAAAPTLHNDKASCNGGLTEEIARIELAGYRGMDEDNSSLDHLVDIAVNCQ